VPVAAAYPVTRSMYSFERGSTFTLSPTLTAWRFWKRTLGKS